MISEVIGYLGSIVQLVLVFLLLRGPFRKYPLLFAYSISQLGASAALAWIVYGGTDTRGPVYRATYWIAEITVDLLLFLAVLTMIHLAARNSPLRGGIDRVLMIVVSAVIVLPFLIYRSHALFSTAWFNGAVQVIEFGAALMILVLWTALIGVREKDHQLLIVSAGLGIAATGAAVSLGIRQFTSPASAGRELANLLGQAAHIAGSLTWCWAFWKSPAAASSNVEKPAA